MRLIDLSQPVYNECPNCPVHSPVRSEIIRDHAKGGNGHKAEPDASDLASACTPRGVHSVGSVVQVDAPEASST